MDVWIIMPAYNEEKRIGKTLEKYSSFFESVSKKDKFSYKILVVINNTKDSTPDIVKLYQKKNKNILQMNLVEGGKGNAVVQGFIEAIKNNADLIGFVDSDMATAPEQYYDLIKCIDGYSGIIANRYLSESKVYPPVTFRRIIVGRMFNFLSRAILLLTHSDTQCGAKVFKRHALEKIIPKITMSQYAFDVELLYLMRKNKFRVKEIPTIWMDKEFSKINFLKAGPWMFLAIVRLRVLNSPLRRLIRVYDLALRLAKKLTKDKKGKII